MILHNVTLYGTTDKKHIHISNGRIEAITADRNEQNNNNAGPRIELNGALALPGFINSHDHLDFNLFPPLGNRIYNNYTEWGKDIHEKNADCIDAVKAVPNGLQIQWSLYKNLLNGFTTVVNHGELLAVDNELVDVFQNCISLHSPAFEKNWRWKLNKPSPKGQIFVMHIGEGTDAVAANEIHSVVKSNYFNKKLVAVHGVAMTEQQASSFEGLVWCPASNYFMLGKTASADKLKKHTKLVFGTDSTLTSSWQIGEQFKQALSSGMIANNELLQMLTNIPASLWSMNDRGKLEPGCKADIIIIRNNSDIFTEGTGAIQLLIKNGEIRVISEELSAVIDKIAIDKMDPISIKGNRLLVKNGLLQLTKDIQSYYPEAIIPFEV
jgi:cytosine/adenosine deaminase-related metal-dependent hydrolase